MYITYSFWLELAEDGDQWPFKSRPQQCLAVWPSLQELVQTNVFFDYYLRHAYLSSHYSLTTVQKWGQNFSSSWLTCHQRFWSVVFLNKLALHKIKCEAFVILSKGPKYYNGVLKAWWQTMQCWHTNSDIVSITVHGHLGSANCLTQFKNKSSFNLACILTVYNIVRGPRLLKKSTMFEDIQYSIPYRFCSEPSLTCSTCSSEKFLTDRLTTLTEAIRPYILSPKIKIFITDLYWYFYSRTCTSWTSIWLSKICSDSQIQ